MKDLTNIADLHIHTTCSDGDLSVDEVLRVAKKKKLAFVGIVDHDTIKQFDLVKNSRLASQMKSEGVRIWVGTEFSCKVDGLKVHILGYNFDHTTSGIAALIKQAQQLRHEDLLNKVENARSLGATITEEQLKKLQKIDNVGRPHIAACIKQNCKENLSIGQIIRKYLDNKKVLRLETPKVIDEVHKAGGIIVIAHPYQIATENHVDEKRAEEIWEKLAALGADGMECFYSKYEKSRILHLAAFAKEHNLLITLGSDYHGSAKPDIKIGMVQKSAK